MDKLKPGDILLLSGWYPIVWFLNLFQKDKVRYGHVAIVGYGGSVYEAAKRIRMVKLESYFKFYKKCKAVSLRSVQPEDIYKIIQKIETKVGKKYGYKRFILQFIDNIFHTNWFTEQDRDENEQVCSSIVAWAYSEVLGIDFNNVPWESCEPDDIDDESENCPSLWESWIIK
jgi:hypothetical protein